MRIISSCLPDTVLLIFSIATINKFILFISLLFLSWSWLSFWVMSDTCDPMGYVDCRLLCQWDFPGKNTGVGCHFLLQGIFSTQGLNACLLHCRQIFLPLSYLGSMKPLDINYNMNDNFHKMVKCTYFQKCF